MREQNASALKIQSFYRSYRARKKAKNVLRNDFETLRTKYKSDDDMTREELISHLLFFYHKDHDASRLVKNCIQNERKLFEKKNLFSDLVLSNLCEKKEQNFEFYKVRKLGLVLPDCQTHKLVTQVYQ